MTHPSNNPGNLAKIRYKSVVYDVANDPAKEAYFVFGVHKSGSSVLNSILQPLARSNGIQYVDVAGSLFKKGHLVREWQTDPMLAQILFPGNLYGGFRTFPIGLSGSEFFLASRKVLLVRDPRDALVSEYFSNAYSHFIPEEGKTRDDMVSRRSAALDSRIDAYVIRMAPEMRRTLREYTALKADAKLITFKYEDIIARKRMLIEQTCTFFGWAVSERQIAQILAWADVMPSEERPTEFVRRVRPGDHLEKLSPDTIATLNDILKEVMNYYGYV